MTKLGDDNDFEAYQHLLYQLMHRPRTTRYGTSLALTSVNAREGVTSVTKHLARALREIGGRRVVQVDVAMLEHEADLQNQADADVMTRPLALDPKSNAVNGPSSSVGRQSRQECIRALSSRLDFLLIDCPALRKSGDVFSITSYVDGVIVVVEAGKTTKQDISFAERQITASGGRIEGYILNHKEVSLAEWFRRILSS